MKIGLLLSHAGPLGIWTPGCKAAAHLAAHELNMSGGVHRRDVDIVVADAGLTTNSAFSAARRLALDHCVDTVIGLQPSNLRGAVERAIRGLAPYLYTAEWEGGHCASGTAALGITSAEILGPSIDWLVRTKRARTFYFIGSDYRWPQVGCQIARDAVAAAGGQMVGAAFLPFGTQDFKRLFENVKRAEPDVVITMQLGSDAVVFHRAFADNGLATRTIRLCLAFDETQLWGIGAENTENIWATQRYFLSQWKAERVSMVERYAMQFGQTHPPPNHTSIACYEAVYIAAGLAARTPMGDAIAVARRIGNGFTRHEAQQYSCRPLESIALQLAEAEGLEFKVRAEL